MHKMLLALPMLLALGCNKNKQDAVEPMAANQDTPSAATAPVATAPGQTMQRSCTDDSACDAAQLCIRAACVNISEGLAECNSVRVLFETNAADLRTEDKRALDRVARCLKADQSMHVAIEGNADARGTSEHNLQLGDRRATAVANYLASLGVADAQLRTISYGEYNPLCVDKDEGCYAKNRRAAVKTRGGAKAASRRGASSM